MSIDRINRNLFVNAYNSNSNRTIKTLNKTKGIDTIEISSLGKNLTDYYSDTNLDSAKKVAEIKSKVESGIYNIDARLTAGSIINVMKESK